MIRQTSFHIAPGTENQIAVTPTTTHTTYSALKRFNPDQRDCYTDDEISLQYLPSTSGYRYGMGNCLFESSFENNVDGEDFSLENPKFSNAELFTVERVMDVVLDSINTTVFEFPTIL